MTTSALALLTLCSLSFVSFSLLPLHFKYFLLELFLSFASMFLGFHESIGQVGWLF